MKLSNWIDHTLLKPDATQEQIKQICDEAKKYGFASICVNPYYAKLVRKELYGSDIKTCVVIGFPLGANTKETKAFETRSAIKNGAQEIDMVINIAALKNKNYEEVLKDIQGVVEIASGKALVKVIIECCLLTEEEKKKACHIAVKAGADFVKTSTGFSTGGATVEDIKLMKSVVGTKAKIKASGGIRDVRTALEMIEAGADRIGASASVKIMEEFERK
jgi:deoxyribose-phosphate aldolase